mgnify:CR=1 FL=1
MTNRQIVTVLLSNIEGRGGYIVAEDVKKLAAILDEKDAALEAAQAILEAGEKLREAAIETSRRYADWEEAVQKVMGRQPRTTFMEPITEALAAYDKAREEADE